MGVRGLGGGDQCPEPSGECRTAAQSPIASRRRPRPVVLVVDGPTRAELFELWISDGCEVRTANTIAEIRDAFEETISVALVRNELPDEAKAEIETRIKNSSPYCRTVVTTTEHVEVMFPGLPYDVCLSEPTTKSAVRQTVDRLTRRSRYQSLLKDYYDVTLGITNMEVGATAAELDGCERYEELLGTRSRLRAELDDLKSTFDSDDLRAVQRDLRPERGFGPETTQRNSRRSEKHKPDTCIGCGRTWDVGTDGSGGAGHRRLGAFVWKCMECGTVQNLPDPSHRRVTKR
ncbi:HalX domain-containing protein [Halomicroarcula sp. GCM10025817]|uniref:HalX domain-containing protein n=1 Tax=Haloarcula TaxID=2237 RepID=UPI0023E75C45|nr:HalX domain-containing protein [Halomicroarcula sp. SYNS111]